jgi:putative ABC transport system permease protein
VAQLLRKAPAVAAVEAWYTLPVRILRGDGRESDDIVVEAPPLPTKLYQPTLLAGRWLEPADRNAVVINSQALDVEPGLALGQEITIKLNEREVRWQVVGIVAGALAGPRMYIAYDDFVRALRNVDETNAVRITLAPADMTNPDGVDQATQIKALESYLQRVGLDVGYLETAAEVRGQVQFQFGILLAFLTMMAVLVLLVGGIGLTGTMSINVLERVAEIGVLRAIGASSPAIMKLFLSEGLVVGLISWLLAAPLALPLSRLLAEQLGLVLIQTPLIFQFSYFGLGISLLFIVVVAAAATFFPARNATQLSVREILSYE